jgi:hypothetical protein
MKKLVAADVRRRNIKRHGAAALQDLAGSFHAW